VIEAQGLRRTVRVRQREVVALAGIDMSVGAGEIVGLLGPEGSGKTVTLRVLATLLKPSGGQAVVAGVDLRRDPGTVRRRVGFVGEGGAVDSRLTGRQELTAQARLHGAGKAAAVGRAAALVASFALGNADRRAASCSPAERRRLDLALAVVHRPRLLLLDEPTRGLDRRARSELWDMLLRLRAEGTTVLLATGSAEEAEALCDRLVVLDSGRVVGHGTPDALKRHVAGDVVTIGGTDLSRVRALLALQPYVLDLRGHGGQLRLYVEHGEAAVPRILSELEDGGVPLGTVTLQRPSLDDVLLRLTGRSLADGPAEAGR
jgi:ABC-2 type transport system ATP-binding protein